MSKTAYYWRCLNCNREWEILPNKCDCGNIMVPNNRTLVVVENLK
jgi:hypothetical protein